MPAIAAIAVRSAVPPRRFHRLCNASTMAAESTRSGGFAQGWGSAWRKKEPYYPPINETIDYGFPLAVETSKHGGILRSLHGGKSVDQHSPGE